MSNMKCPICGKDLVEIELGECWFLVCCNSKCRCKGVASGIVWEYLTVAIKNRKALSKELIRTRKALDLALGWLEKVATPEKCDDDLCREFTKRKVDEIKQLMKGNR